MQAGGETSDFGDGSAYVTGTTQSSDFNTVNPIGSESESPESDSGGPDAFVSKLTPAGNALAYSTLLAGNGADSGNGIALDSSGAAYVTGRDGRRYMQLFVR